MTKKYEVPRAVTGYRLKRYFLQHAEISPKHKNVMNWPLRGSMPSMYVVTKDLLAFKKVCISRDRFLSSEQAVVNLVIPKGALIYAPPMNFDRACDWVDYRKMRASEAHVHSIVSTQGRRQIGIGYSAFISSFTYRPGTTVRPRAGFSQRPVACASGIHFFLNVRDAIDYKF